MTARRRSKPRTLKRASAEPTSDGVSESAEPANTPQQTRSPTSRRAKLATAIKGAPAQTRPDTTRQSKRARKQLSLEDVVWRRLIETALQVDQLATQGREIGDRRQARAIAEVAIVFRALVVAARTGLEPPWLTREASRASAYLTRHESAALRSKLLDAPWLGAGKGKGFEWVSTLLPTHTATPIAKRQLFRAATEFFAARWFGAANPANRQKRWAENAAGDFALFLARIAPRPLPSGWFTPIAALAEAKRKRRPLTDHEARLSQRLIELLDAAAPVPMPTHEEYMRYLGKDGLGVDRMPEHLKRAHWEHPDVVEQAKRFAQAALHVFGYRGGR